MTAESDKQPLLTHLAELRNRLLACALFFFVAFAIAYVYATDIYAFLVQPLADVLEGEQRRLIYTSLMEAFTTYLRVAFWAALCVSFPFILVQIWRFIAPGLYGYEKRAVRPFLVMLPVLFAAGAALAYFYVIPMAWKFFVGFEQLATPGHLPIQLETRMADYLSLTMSLLFAFGVAFEMPIVLLLLIRIGLIAPTDLAAKRRYAIVIIFVVAAILTPPDAISQLCLALPLILLYEGTILFSKLTYKNLRPDHD
ncbi:MAG: twin-arginine translocase subunit TatC [Bdellovibrionales bacterium]